MRRAAWLEILGFAMACTLAVALLYGISRFVPGITPDTPGYLDPGALPEAWSKPRHPLFGWLLQVLPTGPDFARLPLAQAVVFCLAAGSLHWALRSYGLSRRAASAVSLSLLLSNMLLLWHNAVHPECLAAACIVFALAQLVWLASGRHFLLQAPLFGLALGLAYILRPTDLPAIATFPVLYVLLARLAGAERLWRRALLLLCIGALPFLANSAVRWRVVGDFNIVSFGGFAMSGIAGLMLTPEIADRLPEDLRPLAHLIVDRRGEAEARGEVMPTPLNSRGERSFVSAALGYYDIYARTYDAVVAGIIGPLQGSDDWVTFNRRLLRLSVATVAAAPDRYAAWVIGGASRAVGRMIVTNAALVLALLCLAMLTPLAILRRQPASVEQPTLDVPVLVSLTACYTLATTALMILVTFPAARYLDTAGLFLPALPLYAVFSLIRGLARGGRPLATP